MQPTFAERCRNAWNAFTNQKPYSYDYGVSYSYRPDRARLTRGNERSISTAVYNRIALDASSVDIRHVRLDENNYYLSTIKSPLNECFSVEANTDQSGRDFVHDVVLSMLDEGCVAMVPVETDDNPTFTNSYGITKLRTGKIVEWYPQHVRLDVYNELIGRREEITLPKKIVGIVENPFYAVMNEPNSTFQRLVHKLNLLDVVDEQSSSGKLDLIIQLPYIIKSEARRNQAEERRTEIEKQLAGSKYGIAYTDGTERITQLNRSVENNLMGQIEYLTNLFFSQLGMSQAILDGTADEKTMLNYYNRIVDRILSVIVEEARRKFLTKTARSQGQSIMFFRDPFKLMSVNDVAEAADKLTRNEILSSNEVRQTLGKKPSDNPRANELSNKNMPSEKSVSGQLEETSAAIQNDFTKSNDLV